MIISAMAKPSTNMPTVKPVMQHIQLKISPLGGKTFLHD